MEKRRAALVLAGGGARGVAHIGAIEELESQGFEVHAVAGTSMGALVGGMYASGHLEAFKEWMYTLDKYKVFSLVDFAPITRFPFTRPSVLSAKSTRLKLSLIHI